MFLIMILNGSVCFTWQLAQNLTLPDANFFLDIWDCWAVAFLVAISLSTLTFSYYKAKCFCFCPKQVLSTKLLLHILKILLTDSQTLRVCVFSVVDILVFLSPQLVCVTTHTVTNHFWVIKHTVRNHFCVIMYWCIFVAILPT